MPLILSLVTTSRSSSFNSAKLANVHSFSHLKKILSLISIIDVGSDKVYSHHLSTFNHYFFDDNLAIPAFD